MKFNLQLTQKRANYTPALRNRIPRVNIVVPVTHSDALINKWAVIIVKTANAQGFKYNLSNGKAMAYSAIQAHTNGMTYAEAIQYAINL